MAFDFETEVVDLKRQVPRPAVMSTYDGERAWLVHPSHLEQFIYAHQVGEWIGFHVAFDWHVMHRALPPHDNLALAIWEELPEGLLRDAMVLEQLIRLAQGVSGTFLSRGLADLSQEYLSLTLDGDKDTIRKGFGKYVGQPDLSQMSYREKMYSAQDAYATWHLYHALEPIAKAFQPQRGVIQASESRFGYLSETIQIKAAIVLEDVTRNGFVVDRETVRTKLVEHREKANTALDQLVAHDPEIVKRYPKRSKLADQVKVTKSGSPQMNMGRLRLLMVGAAKERGIKLPETEKSHVQQVGVPVLKAVADGVLADHPIVKTWTEYQDNVKLVQFLTSFVDMESVHANYNYLVRSGRTSAWSPNIQQIPREGWFRHIFTAEPGRELVTADYSAIELVTLAAVLEKRYGKSELAQVIRAGKDPHCWTASKFLGRPYEEIYSAVKSGDKAMKQKRQATKALNFGVPGGLGAKKLKGYALNNYGAHLTIEECREFRERLIHEVYPELSWWLDDNLVTRLALTTGAPEAEVERVFGPEARKTWRPDSSPEAMYLAGHKERSNGEAFAPVFCEGLWTSLEHLMTWCKNPWVQHCVYCREPSNELFATLFDQNAITLTGRLRGKVNYGQWRNTQFQGLAADGAKLALWRLFIAGHRIIAFVHDEIVISVPEGDGQRLGVGIAHLMSEEMTQVLGTDLPVGVEWQVGRAWSK